MVLVACFFLADSVSAMTNPMATDCQRMGYTYSVRKTNQGDVGYCVFPDGNECRAADFFKGTCGKQYFIKLEQNASLYGGEPDDLPICGNGICEAGESTLNCPKDCIGPTTTLHVLCGNKICDRGENVENCPNDCGRKTTAPPTPAKTASRSTSMIVLVILLAALIALYLYYKKKK